MDKQSFLNSLYSIRSSTMIYVFLCHFLLNPEFNRLCTHSRAIYSIFPFIPILQTFLDFVTQGRPFDVPYIVEMRRVNEIGNKNFCFNLPDMTSLTPYDRMSLIQNNFHHISGLQVRRKIRSTKDDLLKYYTYTRYQCKKNTF